MSEIKKFNIPMAVTVVLLTFFALFRAPIANLISRSDCLELAFFETTINTCKEKELQEMLAAEQDSIAGLVKTLTSALKNSESANLTLKNELKDLKRELANSAQVSDSQRNAIVSKIDSGIAKNNRILSDERFSIPAEARKIEKYSTIKH